VPKDPAQTTLRRLTVIVALQWMGATLGLPLLPLFLEHRGGTPSVVGVVMASFFVAGVATQFAFGHWPTGSGDADYSSQPRGLRTGQHDVPLPVSPRGSRSPGRVPGSVGRRDRSGVDVGGGLALSRERSAVARSRRSSPPSSSVSRSGRSWASSPPSTDLGLGVLRDRHRQSRGGGRGDRTNLGDRAYDPTPAAEDAVEYPQLTAPSSRPAPRDCDRRLRGVLEPLDARPPRETLQIRLSWTFFGLPFVVLSAGADGSPTTPIVARRARRDCSTARSFSRSIPTSTTTI
jgi:hypothetical protein